MNAPEHLMVGRLPDEAVSVLLSAGCHVMMHPDQFARLFPHLPLAVVWKKSSEDEQPECSEITDSDYWLESKCIADATVQREGKWYCDRHDPQKEEQARRSRVWPAAPLEMLGCPFKQPNGCYYVSARTGGGYAGPCDPTTCPKEKG